MASITLISLDEYLRTSYHPDCDWIKGEVRERNMGEGPHSAIQKFFIVFFAAKETAWRIRVWPEHRVQVAPDRFRVPDVCLTRAGNASERVIRTAPMLCIEVLSPEDRMGAMQEKIDDYLAMGVEAVWVVDPSRRRAYQTKDASITAVDELTVAGTPVLVKVEDVFADLDELGFN